MSRAAQVDTIIVGGGVIGLSTAWNLARRGQRVLLLERFAPGHTRGASHGATRNFNPAYADPAYVGLLRRARQALPATLKRPRRLQAARKRPSSMPP